MGKDSTRAVAKMSLDPADLTHDTVSWVFYKEHNFATENKIVTASSYKTVVRLNIGFHQTFATNLIASFGFYLLDGPH